MLADNFINPSYYANSGNQEIKEQRRKKLICPDRYVGDYVPFYFAPRSPMLFRQYRMGQIENEKIIYLVTDAATLALKYEWCFSNTNAARTSVQYYFTWQEMLNYIDWDVMKLRYWYNNDSFPNRKERRMAEFLVYQKVAHIDFSGIAIYNNVR